MHFEVLAHGIILGRLWGSKRRALKCSGTGGNA
jgi:hypothetical protein